MILGDRKIKKAVAKGDIVISPYDSSAVGQNSYDVHLGKRLAVYTDAILDVKQPPNVRMIDIPEEGYVLSTNELYLGVTEEFAGSNKYVPNVDGKSSVGRLGIFIHVTAGRGDVGYINYWTLEIVAVKPVRVYAGMPIGQLTFHKTTRVDTSYSKKDSAKYSARNPDPVPSKMWMNFLAERNASPTAQAVPVRPTTIVSGSIGPMNKADIKFDKMYATQDSGSTIPICIHAGATGAIRPRLICPCSTTCRCRTSGCY